MEKNIYLRWCFYSKILNSHRSNRNLEWESKSYSCLRRNYDQIIYLVGQFGDIRNEGDRALVTLCIFDTLWD